ncbi:unnamed protein product [Urochloa decumbens]|uniref:F-box domain-containing protein n=1 Tax=Urochloa decumbens TaxID=240449 RepID=A0ABC9GY07_9POAL
MAPWEIAKKAPVASGSNGIDALPDGVLEHILGFLPAPEAVRTCVLARRWRHLWKFATGLRINIIPDHAKQSPSYEELLQFVEHLLEHRGLAPLETCELRFVVGYTDAMLYLNRWIQHVVMCKVQMLRLSNTYHGWFQLDPLVSQHLMRLELVGLMLTSRFCDLSNCPALEHLEFDDCNFSCIQKISSESLKCLCIRNSFPDYMRLTILFCVPSLVSFRLDDHWCRTPVFQSVPLLQEAFVRVTGVFPDCCCDEPGHEDGDVEDCFSCYNIEHDNKRLLLEGLSEVVNLSMIAESRKVILDWDLKQWPQFNNLKTLLLNDCWCVAPKFHALTCILKHSPLLEKLTLELFSKEPEHKMEIFGRCNPMERSPAISQHLKSIEVKCEVVDKDVQKVLRFLCTLNISFIFK